MNNKRLIFDTTLRDGSQAEKVSFTVNDKLTITRLLDDFGVHYIEGGWPGSNPKDMEYFKLVRQNRFKNALITVFSSVKRAEIKDISKDANLMSTVASEADVACIFGKSWDFHVKEVLKISPSANLEVIFDSVSFLKKYFKEVVFDMEHFFDGYKNNPDYALKVLEAAKQGGADFLVFCDTNGGSMPWEIESIIDEISNKALLPTKYGIHAHNDSELGVVNSLVALKKGALMVQGTMNGFGERCGNANLVSIIANSQLKMGIEFVPSEKIKQLTRLSHEIAEISNLGYDDCQPFTGKSAFAHKGGIHVSAILKNPHTYEHVAPEAIGNSRRVLVSDLSGNSNLRYKLKEWKLEKKFSPDFIKSVLKKLKVMELEGYAFEGADAGLELFLVRESKQLPAYFEILNYRVMDEKLSDVADPSSVATVKFKVGNNKAVQFSSSEGHGPVDSLVLSLKNGLAGYYPLLDEVRLVDYKVRILGSVGGTDAKVRVLITSKCGEIVCVTVGASFDVISASFIAMTDAINYILFKTNTNPYILK